MVAVRFLGEAKPCCIEEPEGFDFPVSGCFENDRSMLFKLFIKYVLGDQVFAAPKNGKFEQTMSSSIPAPELSAREVLFDGALSDGSWIANIPMVDM